MLPIKSSPSGAETGRGLGPMLLRRILDHARLRGIREIYGEILKDNNAMIRLSKALGFTVQPHPDDSSLVHAVATTTRQVPTIRERMGR